MVGSADLLGRSLQDRRARGSSIRKDGDLAPALSGTARISVALYHRFLTAAFPPRLTHPLGAAVRPLVRAVALGGLVV